MLLDTDVVVHLRDGVRWVEAKIAELSPPFFISAISRIELENGAARGDHPTDLPLLDHVLSYVRTLEFGREDIEQYRRIVRECGYSRRKAADRMTAATALAHGMPLVTLNGRDYRDVPGLDLIAWAQPA